VTSTLPNTVHRPRVAGLDAASRHTVGAHHLLQTRLNLRPQVKVVLEHPAEQLAALHIQTLLQFTVGELMPPLLGVQLQHTPCVTGAPSVERLPKCQLPAKVTTV
jgi:hypothetical protein